MAKPTLSWRPHPIVSFGLTIDVLDGADVTEGDATDLHYLLQQKGAAQIGVWIGASQSLAQWRERFGTRAPRFGNEATATICGRAGAKQEVAVGEEQATGLVPTGDGGIGHIYANTPAQVHVAVAATTKAGVPFVASWVVVADQRDALRADEDHFLASLRCD